DFCSDRSVTRLLEVDCQLSDDFLIGHALRIGLAGGQTMPHTMERLLPTIRNDVLFEHDRIRDANFPNLFRIREVASPAHNRRALAEFLAISMEQAEEIAAK